MFHRVFFLVVFLYILVTYCVYESHERGSPTTDEINTEQFMDNVLPASERTPYLIYFFHDFCDRCEDWSETLSEIKTDIRGIKMAKFKVITGTKVTTYCNVYVQEVPQLVLVLNRKLHPFQGPLSVETVKQFVYDHLPSNTTRYTNVNNVNDILSMESRIINNKPVVLLVSPQETPSLEYKIAAFNYQQYLIFYYLSSFSVKANESELEMFNLTEGDKVLLLYSDSNDSVVTLKGKNLTIENMMNVFETHKWLSVPRVNSCAILDELCPVGKNMRSCVLLVANGDEKVTENFRAFVRKQRDITFNTGILNPNQNSTLRSAISWHDHPVDDSCGYDTDLVAKPVVVIHRLTNSKLEYNLLPNYCGTDNSRLLELLRNSKHARPAIMSTPCSFDPEKCPLENVYVQGFSVQTEKVLMLFTALQDQEDNRLMMSAGLVVAFVLVLIHCVWQCRPWKKRKQSEVREVNNKGDQQAETSVCEMREARLLKQIQTDKGNPDSDIVTVIDPLISQVEDRLRKEIINQSASLKWELTEQIQKEFQNQHQNNDSDSSNENNGESCKEWPCNTDKAECERRNKILSDYIKNRDWYTSQEFDLLHRMITKPKSIPGWQHYYQEYPLIYNYEWESPGSGKGDLLCTDGDNRFLVVEVKSLLNSGPGSKENQHNGQRKKKRKGESQAKKYAEAWHYGNPQVKSTTGIFVTNEETQFIIELPNEDQSSIEGSINKNEPSNENKSFGDQSKAEQRSDIGHSNGGLPNSNGGSPNSNGDSSCGSLSKENGGLSNGGDTSSKGGDTSSKGGDTSSKGGDTSKGGDASSKGGDTSNKGGSSNSGSPKQTGDTSNGSPSKDNLANRALPNRHLSNGDMSKKDSGSGGQSGGIP